MPELPVRRRAAWQDSLERQAGRWRRARRLLVPALLLSLSAAVSAQPGQMVPTPFVEAMLAGSDGTVPELLPGSLPERFESLLPLPEGALVLGSLVQETSVRVAASHSADRAAALADMKEVLEGVGWQPPPPGRPTFELAYPPLGFCLESGESLRLTVLPREEGSLLLLDLQTERLDDLCVAPSGGRPFGVDFPPLVVPPKTRILAQSASLVDDLEVGDAQDLSMVLRTDLPGDALLRHFAGQLAAAGWQVRSEVVGLDVALQSWHLRSAGGQELSGLLTVTELGRKRHEVMFRIVRKTDP